MKEQLKARFEDSGVSPVIGVILMVAVTVALVALVTVIVFDIGGDVSESPDATVDLSQDGNNVTATVLRNENVDSFKVRGTYDDGSGNGLSSASAQLYHTTDGSSNGVDTLTYTGDYDMSSVGDKVTVYDEVYEDSDNTDGTLQATYTLQQGQVQVIAVMSDGSEQVLTTTTYDG